MAQGRGPGGHFMRGFMTEEEKANQPKVTPALLKRIFSYLRPYSARLALVLVCIVAASFFTLLPSILTTTPPLAMAAIVCPRILSSCWPTMTMCRRIW